MRCLIFFFQRLVAAQNRRIDQLVEKIKQQQDKLEKQSLHLKALQSKVSLHLHKDWYRSNCVPTTTTQNCFASETHCFSMRFPQVAQKRVKSHRRRDEETALKGEAELIYFESGNIFTLSALNRLIYSEHRETFERTVLSERPHPLKNNKALS